MCIAFTVSLVFVRPPPATCVVYAGKELVERRPILVKRSLDYQQNPYFQQQNSTFQQQHPTFQQQRLSFQQHQFSQQLQQRGNTHQQRSFQQLFQPAQQPRQGDDVDSAQQRGDVRYFCEAKLPTILGWFIGTLAISI